MGRPSSSGEPGLCIDTLARGGGSQLIPSFSASVSKTEGLKLDAARAASARTNLIEPRCKMGRRLLLTILCQTLTKVSPADDSQNRGEDQENE